MTLACKHVDDVIIGALYIITEDLITSLRIKKVIVITDTEEDKPMRLFKDIDQFEVPRKLGILQEVTVNSSFYDMTMEKIANRVLENRQAIELKVQKKKKSENLYYQNKQFNVER